MRRPLHIDVTILEAHTTHKATLEQLSFEADKRAKWRKIATIATVAGALFAFLRLGDILIAIRRRR